MNIQMNRDKWDKATVIENYAWNDSLFSLKVSANINPYIAGQFTRFGLSINGEHIARPYSLVDKDNKSPLEIYFNTVEEGSLSSQLAKLKAGDSIDVFKQAVGFFTLDEVPPGRDLWLLATGTGLGPYISILATEKPWQSFERIILVHGVSHVTDLGYAEHLLSLARERPKQLSYIQGVTQEKTETGFNCRIPAAINSGILEDLAGATISSDYSRVMICGNMEMIQDTITVLEERGLKKHRRAEPGQITTEKYW